MIRGISSKDYIDDNGRVSGSLFQFIDTKREDGFCEASINWYDEKESLQCVLDQKKDDGTLQFKCGAAILSRSWLDELIRKPTAKNVLSYERAPFDNNKYHGNILRKDCKINKEIQRGIAGSIAMGVEKIIYQK
jgi:hypothetical protein